MHALFVNTTTTPGFKVVTKSKDYVSKNKCPLKNNTFSSLLGNQHFSQLHPNVIHRRFIYKGGHEHTLAWNWSESGFGT